MDIKCIIKDLIRTRNLQQWINNRFYDPCKELVDTNVFDYVSTGGTKFNFARTDMICETQTEYNHSDIRKSDIMLDVGANVGGFGLYHAKEVKHVYAVEPIFTEEFNNNLELNGFKNVSLLPYALSHNDINISFGRKNGFAEGKTLTELINMAGGHIDFLKCDCEGGEWCIKPEELEGIRRIEMEVHSFNGENMYDFVSMINNLGYKTEIDATNTHSSPTLMIHAWKK